MLMFIRHSLLAQAFSKDNHNFLTKQITTLQEKARNSALSTHTRENQHQGLCAVNHSHMGKCPSRPSAVNAANLELQKHISEAVFALPIMMLFISPRSFAASLCSTP